MPAPSRLRRLFAFGKKFKFIMEKALVSLSQKETESLKMGVGGGEVTKRGRGPRRAAEAPPARQLETNKNAGGVAHRLPGAEAPGRAPGSAGTRGESRGRARGRESESPAPRPGARPRVGPGASCAPPPRGPGGAPTQRGLQVPGSPEAGAGRGLAQFPGIWRAGKRRGGRSGGGRRARGRAGRGRGRGRGRRGPEPCVPGRGLAGQAAGGARSGLRGLHGACGSVPARRAAHSRLGAGGPGAPGGAGRSARTYAAAGEPRAARPLPPGRPSAPALGARRPPGL